MQRYVLDDGVFSCLKDKSMFPIAPIMAVRGDGISCYFALFGQPISGWTWKRENPTQIRFGISQHQQVEKKPKAKAKASVPAKTVVSKPQEVEKPTSSVAKSSELPLTMISGVGPKLEERLKEQGVISLEQIASWSLADIEAIEEKLGNLQNRIRRDDWVGQAKELLKK